MESNGKFVTKGGQRVNYQTGVRISLLLCTRPSTYAGIRSLLSGVLPGQMASIHSTNSSIKARSLFRRTSWHPLRRITVCGARCTTAFYFPTTLHSPRLSHLVKPRRRSALRLDPTQVKHLSRAKSLRAIAPVTASSSRSSRPQRSVL
jgi:hypothetical protein